MAKPPIDPHDPVFEKHAVYIFKALQNVQTCVVFDGAQLASEPGFPKASSVQTQISRIAARWGLNIRATTGGGAGDVGGVRAPRGKEVTPRKRKQLAVKWREESGDDEDDVGVGVDMDVAEVPRSMKAKKSPRTPKAKKREQDFVSGFGGEIDELLDTVLGTKEGAYEIWNRTKEKASEEGRVTNDTEVMEVTETIEAE